jgi:hypothetical protein
LHHPLTNADQSPSLRTDPDSQSPHDNTLSPFHAPLPIVVAEELQSSVKRNAKNNIVRCEKKPDRMRIVRTVASHKLQNRRHISRSSSSSSRATVEESSHTLLALSQQRAVFFPLPPPHVALIFSIYIRLLLTGHFFLSGCIPFSNLVRPSHTPIANPCINSIERGVAQQNGLLPPLLSVYKLSSCCSTGYSSIIIVHRQQYFQRPRLIDKQTVRHLLSCNENRRHVVSAFLPH